MRSTTQAVLVALALLAAPALACAQDGGALAANEAVARRFYDAWTRHDFATEEALYAPDVKWKDTLTSFDDREGTVGMWRALAAADPNAKFSYEITGASGDTVTVAWHADYHLFGNPVHNDVAATLVIRDGQIVEHTDDYSWDRWARQVFPALGDAVSNPVLGPVLRTTLGAALHVQSLVANAKNEGLLAVVGHGVQAAGREALGWVEGLAHTKPAPASPAPEQKDEKGIVQKFDELLGK